MEEKIYKFIDRFKEFIDLLRAEKIIPEVQIEELERNPVFNPGLSTEPQDWWKESFDWYVAVPAIANGLYGPFYRIDGEHFWPQIGIPDQRYSEKMCFPGLKKPMNQEEAQKLYNLKSETPISG